jgi:hypothetical protein
MPGIQDVLNFQQPLIVKLHENVDVFLSHYSQSSSTDYFLLRLARFCLNIFRTARRLTRPRLSSHAITLTGQFAVGSDSHLSNSLDRNFRCENNSWSSSPRQAAHT